MKSLDDTIAAISTPLGQGGIGIMRMSGPEALPITRRLFQPSRGRADAPWPAFRLRHGFIVDPATGARVDEVLVAYMPAPRTYTRQDIVEINGHGGIVALRRILELALREGARLAEPGEFTLRAFVNGRIDLAQAEAVLDIVNAQTDAALRLAVGQLEGRLSAQVRHVRERLVSALAYLEATIDFVEDEIPPQDIGPALREAADAIRGLLRGADQGIMYRQGIRTAIVGRPNVGKSSLLNALLRTDRAIVTPIPGTTRDTLEETLNLQGVPFVLVDTAGIAGATADPVEQLGIERSRRAVRQADLILVIVDGSEPLRPEDHAIAELTQGRTAIAVVNKCDLPTVANLAGFLPGAPQVRISALTGQGLDDLRAAMLGLALGGEAMASNGILVSSVRHKEALARALDHVEKAETTYRQGLPADFVTIDLRAALDALGEITGQTVTPDLVDNIFANFCIGK
ncbi:MAG: tRNA uridine-5-carboxymethylaminomethyl(34) synthesis GTPase MnmE [Anaerolineae bacterium]|nr:tRNA uridine-5-carboxymethylaminomethyl(34) synthesis GTPase MnmE [Anaerolineae bacterium]